MEALTSPIKKLTSEQYIDKFLNMFWKRNIISYGDNTTSIIAQLDDKMEPLKPQGFRISTFINELGLENKLFYSMRFAGDLLLGYKFVDTESKLKFEEWAAKATSLCLLPIQPKPHNVISIRIHAFPLGLMQELVKAQLLNYGTVNNFNYLLDRDCAFDLPINDAVFDVTLKVHVNKDNFPTFLSFNGINILLFCKGWPPTCSYCKKRGHRAFECPVYYCTSCRSRVPRPHDCQSHFTSNKAFQSMALNDSQSRLLEIQLGSSMNSRTHQVSDDLAVDHPSLAKQDADLHAKDFDLHSNISKDKTPLRIKNSNSKSQNSASKPPPAHCELTDPCYSSQSSGDESDLQHDEDGDRITNMDYMTQAIKRKDISTASEEEIAPRT